MEELFLARKLERHLNKREILLLYLNQIYFGNGNYGIGEAARFYLGKSVRDLSVADAALLVSQLPSPENYTGIISLALGITLILTSAVIIFHSRLSYFASKLAPLTSDKIYWLTPLMGLLLGVLVTLSSVGAGAIATALLMILYPTLKSLNIVGTDIAHAVPLTLFAGLGHLMLGNVDLYLLVALIAGSLPAVFLGARLARHIPDRVLRPILATTLFGAGVKVVFF